MRRHIGLVFRVATLVLAIASASYVMAREEPIQSATLPSARVEIDPKADYGPDAPPPYYPLEEINQNVFRGVRHGFVNTTTGNLAFGVLDLKLPGRMPIEFRRVYDSGISAYLPPPPPNQQNEPRWNADLGLNWALGYASYLIPLSGGVLMATPEGDVLWWTEQTGGVFVRQNDAPTRHMKLQRQSSTVVVETQIDGTVWTYTWTVSASGSAYVLTEIKDRSNNKITLTYNQGYLSHIQNTDGAYIDIFRPLFDATYPTTIFPRSRVTKLTDSTGRIVRFDYNNAGLLIKATDVFAKDWTYSYDVTSSKLLSATNPLGQVYLNATYDGSMRTATYEANAGPWSFAYNQSGKTKATDGLGHIWEYSPSTSGITFAVKEPTLGQHTLTLNSANNPISYSGPSGEQASWTYDSNHRPLTHSPAGTTSTITYTYDATNGWVNTITGLTGGVTTFTRDSAGRVTQESDAYGDKTTATYAANGDRLTMRLPRGNVQNPDGAYLWTFTYDGFGNPITATDPSVPTGRVFEMQYSSLGDLYKLRRPDHVDSGTGQLVKAEWTYSRDLVGRVTTSVDPLLKAWTRTYDDAGRLIRVQGPAGTNIRYAYDARYRLTDIWNDAVAPPVDLVSFTYDAAGRLATRTLAAGGTYTYDYDASNRLTEVTDPASRIWLYDRDASGRVTRVTFPGGRYVTITRDSGGRISARDFPGGRHEGFTYDASSQLLTASATDNGNSAQLTWVRDLLERPTSLQTQVGWALSSTARALSYTYDPDGNRATLVDSTNPGTTLTFVYDGLDRLTHTTPSGAFGWQATYDPYSGHRITVTVPDGTLTDSETWSYDMAGHITVHKWGPLNAPDTGNLNFVYDDEGRVITQNDTVNSVTDQMAYRLDGLVSQMAETKAGATTTTTYSYDAGGKVIGTSAVTGNDPAVPTVFQYDAIGRLTYSRRDQTSRTYTWSDLPADQASAFEVWQAPNDPTQRTLEIEYGYDERLRRVSHTYAQEAGSTVGASYLWAPLDSDLMMGSTDEQSDGSMQSLETILDLGGPYFQETSAGGGGGYLSFVTVGDNAKSALALSRRGAIPDGEAPLRVGWSEPIDRFAAPLALSALGLADSSSRNVVQLAMGAEARPRVTIANAVDGMTPARPDFVDDWSGTGVAASEWHHNAGAAASIPGSVATAVAGVAASPFVQSCHRSRCDEPTLRNSMAAEECPQHPAQYIAGPWAMVPSADRGAGPIGDPYAGSARPACAISKLGYPPTDGQTCHYIFGESQAAGTPDSPLYPDITASGISLQNGDFVQSATDLNVFDEWGDVSFSRTYRSGVSTTGMLGPKWASPWEEKLDFGHDKTLGDTGCGYVARWIRPDGSFTDFPNFPPHDPNSPPQDEDLIRKQLEAGATIRKDTPSTGLYSVQTSDGAVRVFSSSGQLQQLNYLSHGYQLTYGTGATASRVIWITSGAIDPQTGVLNASQNRLHLTYYSTEADNGKLMRVEDPSASTTRFANFYYNATCGELEHVEYPSTTLGDDKSGAPINTQFTPITSYVYANTNTTDCKSSAGPGFHMLTAVQRAQYDPLTSTASTVTTLQSLYGFSIQGAADPLNNKVVRQCFGRASCDGTSRRVDYEWATPPRDTSAGEVYSDLPFESKILDRRTPGQTVEERHHYYRNRLRWTAEDYTGLNRVTKFTYDGTNTFLTQITRPDQSCEVREYAGFGSVTKIQDVRVRTKDACNGVAGASPDKVTYYTYDWVTGRVLTVTGPEAFPSGTFPGNFDPHADAYKKFTVFHYYDVDQTQSGHAYSFVLGNYCTTWSLPCPAKLGDLNGNVGDDGYLSGGEVREELYPFDATVGQYGTALVTTTAVSVAGRPTKRTGPDGVSSQFSYYVNGAGNWDWRAGGTNSSDPAGSGPLASISVVPNATSSHPNLTTKFGYDVGARRVVSQDPQGVRAEQSFAADNALLESRVCAPDNSLSSACDPAVPAHQVLRYTRYTHDLLGRSVRTATYQPDPAAGNHTPMRLTSTWTTFDALGRSTSVTVDPNTSVNPGGAATSSPSALHLLSTVCYDGKDRVKRAISPEGRVACFEYDALGRQTATIKYDAINFSGATCGGTFGDPELLSEDSCGSSTDATTRSTVTYDLMDRPYSSTDPRGTVTYQWYDDFGRPQIRSDGLPPGGQVPAGLTAPIDAARWYAQTWYDLADRPTHTTLKGRNGRQTSQATCSTTDSPATCGFLSANWTAYDNLGRTTQSAVALYPADFVPDAVATSTAIPVSNVALTRTTYRSSDGKPDQRIDAGGRAVTIGYDEFGRATSVALPAVAGQQDQVIKEFDDSGRPKRFSRKSTTAALSNSFDEVTDTAYDAWGRVARTTGAPSAVASSPEDLITTFAYDGLSRQTAAARRYQVSAAYNGLDANDRDSETQYDAASRVTVARIRSHAGPDAFADTTYSYDRDGLMTSLTDAKANKTDWSYLNTGGTLGGLGRLLKTQYPAVATARQTITPTYDANGNPLTVRFQKTAASDPAIVWTQTFDRYSRLITRDASFVNFDNGDPTFYGTTHQDYAYDDVGRMVKALDRAPVFGSAQDVVVENFFDTGGRLLKDDQELPLNGVLAHHAVESSYLSDGFRGTLSYPPSTDVGGNALDRYVLTMTEDALGRLGTITGPQGPQEPPSGGTRPTGRSLLQYTYLGDKIWNRWSGNNIESRFWDTQSSATTPLYDALGRLRGVRAVDAGGSNPTVTDFRYGYDRLGNLTYEQRVHEPLNSPGGTVRTRAYQTDLLGRLAEWTEGGLAKDSVASPAISRTDMDPTDNPGTLTDGETWTLDMLGNWSSRTSGVSPSTVTDTYQAANPLNQYASVTPAGGSQDNFTFDWLGQLRQNDRSNQAYSWDAFGRLTQVYPPGSPSNPIATYRYDALNRRVEKTIASGVPGPDTTTRYLYDGWRAIEERAVVDAGGGLKREAVRARYGFGLALDEVVWMDRDTAGTGTIGSRYFLTDDALGSVAAATADRTDFSQPVTVLEHYTYSAYGKPQVWTGAWQQSGGYSGTPQGVSTIGMPYLYTGQRLDAESGVYYFKNRPYDPVAGRFLRRDALGYTGGPNSYLYASSRPSFAVDPLGLLSEELQRQRNPFGATDRRAGDVLHPMTSQDSAGSRMTGVSAAYANRDDYAVHLARRAALNPGSLTSAEIDDLTKALEEGLVPPEATLGFRLSVKRHIHEESWVPVGELRTLETHMETDQDTCEPVEVTEFTVTQVWGLEVRDVTETWDISGSDLAPVGRAEGDEGLSGALKSTWDALENQFTLTKLTLNMAKLAERTPRWLEAGGKVFTATSIATKLFENPGNAADKAMLGIDTALGAGELLTTAVVALEAAPLVAVLATFDVGLGVGHLISMTPVPGPDANVGELAGDEMLAGVNGLRRWVGYEPLDAP